jgi:hypothetical protein
MQKSRVWISLFLAAVALLGVNLFYLSPEMGKRVGELTGNNVYITVRLVTLFGFSFLTSWLAEKPRIFVIRKAAFLVLIDQIVFKAIFLLQQFQSSPQNWEGVDHSGVLFSLAMSYVMTLPIIVLIAFMGTELGSLLLKKQKSLYFSS